MGLKTAYWYIVGATIALKSWKLRTKLIKVKSILLSFAITRSVGAGIDRLDHRVIF